MKIKDRKRKQIRFTRINGTPIVTPDPRFDWEAGGVFAPAVIRESTSWKMLYRAVGQDNISRLGYAESLDGIEWEKAKKPRVLPDHTGLEYSGIEDPRIVKIDGRYLVTYTAYAKREKEVQTRIRILETKDFCEFQHVTPDFDTMFHQNDKDGVLFPEKINGQYCMLHRLEPDIQLSTSEDLVGQTHPVILKEVGEVYREGLIKQATRLGVCDHLQFVNEYLPTDKLVDYFTIANVYLTIHSDPEQAASGTLAYALGCGLASISTPYRYAKEVLGDGRGFLVPFGSSGAIAKQVNELVENKVLLDNTRRKAALFGCPMSWARVGEEYLNLAKAVLQESDQWEASRPLSISKI